MYSDECNIIPQDKITSRLYQKAFEQRRPINVFCELTCKCNFHCKMCGYCLTDEQIKERGRMLTVAEWLDLAEQMKQAGVLELVLTGGEPTTYPGFVELYEKLNLMGFKIAIKTNASCLTGKIADIISKYPPQYIMTSLYGATPETYFEVTGDKNGFDKVMSGLDFITSLGIKLNLVFIVIKQTMHEYPLAFDIARKYNAHFSINTDIHPHIDGLYHNELVNCRISLAQRVTIKNNHPYNIAVALKEADELESKLAYFIKPSQKEIFSNPKLCANCVVGCSLQYNGFMQYCEENTTNRIDAKLNGFIYSWNRLLDEMDTYFPHSIYCDNCDYRNYCKANCPARLFLENKSLCNPDFEYFCKYAFLTKVYLEKE